MRTRIYWSGLFVIAISIAVNGFVFAQESADDHVIPAPQQPAPEIPPVPASAISPVNAPPSFSILSRDHSEPGEKNKAIEENPATESKGTFTSNTEQNRDASSGTGFKPSAQPPSSQSSTAPPTATSAFGDSPSQSNGLRPVATTPADHPLETDSPSNVLHTGDSQLPFDQAPMPPQPNDEPVPSVPGTDLQRGTRLPGEDSHFDQRRGATPPPVNQAPGQVVRNASIVPASPAPAGNASGVNTVSFEPPTSPPQRQAEITIDLTPARQSMARYELGKSNGPLPGTPAKLADLLRNATLSQRSSLIKQYWTAYEDWAMLVNAQQNFLWLSQVQRPDSPSDQLLLTAARGSASNLIIESEIRLDEAMAMLQRLARLNPASRPPLPSDRPLLETFHTRYAFYSKREPLPFVLKTIDRNLPKMLHLIADRGETAQMLQSVASQNQMAYVNRETGFASVLVAAQMWNVAERDLIRSVGKYNRSTAEYATRFRPSQSNRKLVAMVIAKPRMLDGGRSALSRTADATSLPAGTRPGGLPVQGGRRAALPPNSIALPPSQPTGSSGRFSPPANSNTGSSFNLQPLNPSSSTPSSGSRFGTSAGSQGTLPDTGGFRPPNQGGGSFSPSSPAVTPPPTNNGFGGFGK